MSRFRDLRTNLDCHPISGDLLVLEDENAISTQIKNLIFTEHYERHWNATQGAGVPQTLFENVGVDSEDLITVRIRETINNNVSRANLLDVKVSAGIRNNLDVTIVYQPQNSFEPVTVNIILKRVR